jgi:hypothetical protein
VELETLVATVETWQPEQPRPAIEPSSRFLSLHCRKSCVLLQWLALIIHLARHASGENVDERKVDEASMDAGIKLTRWFCRETRRVYAVLDQSETERGYYELADWIRRKGGNVSVPDVQGGHRRFRTADETEAALNELVASGLATGSTSTRQHDESRWASVSPVRAVIRLTPSTKPHPFTEFLRFHGHRRGRRTQSTQTSKSVAVLRLQHFPGPQRAALNYDKEKRHAFDFA